MHLSKISLALRQWGAGGGFSPLSLFSSGEQGAWYDPSDLSTMFQDAEGTTPVTAVGQPVGLILDKSQGLVLGPELVVNGGFDSATGWTLSGTTTISGGLLHAASASSEYMATQLFPFVSGKTYELTIVVPTVTSGNLSIIYGVGTNVNALTVISSGTFKSRVAAGSGNIELRILSSGAGFVGTIDNISIKELPGNHASQATAASRPLLAATGLSEWTNYDGVDDVLNTTFPSSLGSSCTVARANVGGAPTILTGQTIGTTYADSTDNAGLIIIDRALTTQETTDLTTWLTAKGAIS